MAVVITSGGPLTVSRQRADNMVVLHRGQRHSAPWPLPARYPPDLVCILCMTSDPASVLRERLRDAAIEFRTRFSLNCSWTRRHGGQPPPGEPCRASSATTSSPRASRGLLLGGVPLMVEKRWTRAPDDRFYAAGMTASATTSWIVDGCRSWWRSSWSRRTAAGVWMTPRQPRPARSSTAHTSDKQDRSPGRRPITLVLRRVSPKVRSIRLEWRIRDQCSVGKRR
jgi:hypothetical protein